MQCNGYDEEVRQFFILPMHCLSLLYHGRSGNRAWFESTTRGCGPIQSPTSIPAALRVLGPMGSRASRPARSQRTLSFHCCQFASF